VTVVIAVKVFDGIVVASDSATTLPLVNGSYQVYNSANKIFHLHRQYPVLAATWGLGSIGSASIATLAKDLRRRFMGKDPTHLDWALTDNYTVEGVTDRLLEMMYTELYSKLVTPTPGVEKTLGFLVAGYSPNDQKGEMWKITIVDAPTPPTVELIAGPDQVGCAAFAIDEAANRLLHGYDSALGPLLRNIVDPARISDLENALQSMHREAAPPVMPFSDAINFASFLADTTIGYMHFLLGPDVVGPPVEIAGISRHEGFKWIQRKHYYPAYLNPEDPGHDY
jgi:hypothetical protein